jgi:hypothetical protein
MNDYVIVSVIENEIEARLLESILQERDIPHRMVSYHDTAYDGLFQTQKGWGDIRVPESFLKLVRQIVSDVREEAAARAELVGEETES